MATHPFAGSVKMKPTLKHRAAIWECMLGTVYARNAAGTIRYFDYDWRGAREFAGITDTSDLRLAKTDRGLFEHNGPSKGQLVLWVKDAA